MRPQLCLFAAVALSINLISAFSFQGKNNNNNNGLQIPKTGAAPDLATAASSLSQKSVTKASNNQFMSYLPTKRDTIKMPSQTPMVPWTVRFGLFTEKYERVVCGLVNGNPINSTFPRFFSFCSLYLCNPRKSIWIQNGLISCCISNSTPIVLNGVEMDHVRIFCLATIENLLNIC